MFVGLGGAERRLLLIIRPGVPLTVTDAKRIYPETDHRTHRRAMVSLARKGFVQVQPGPVFAIGVACERTTRRGSDAVAASRSELSEGVGMMRHIAGSPSNCIVRKIVRTKRLENRNGGRKTLIKTAP